MRRGKVQVIGSKFDGNRAEDSGGSIVVHTSYIKISYCIFENESVVFGYGGSVCALDIGYVTIQHSSFRRCSAAFGGSLSVMSETIMSIEYSMITESSSNTTGGAVYINHDSSLKSTNISILNCSSASGGGISCRESLINLDVGMLSSNRALLSSGGGLFLEKCQVTIDDFNFTSNNALQYGGGLYTQSTSIAMHNTKYSQNTAGKMGGFMWITKSSRLFGQNWEFGQNKANYAGSNLAISNNSVAELKHLHRYSLELNDPVCPIVVQRSSDVIVTSLYHSSFDSGDSRNNNRTMDPDIHVCSDTISKVNGNVTSGKFITWREKSGAFCQDFPLHVSIAFREV